MGPGPAGGASPHPPPILICQHSGGSVCGGGMDAMGGGGRPLHYHCYCYHWGGWGGEGHVRSKKKCLGETRATVKDELQTTYPNLS